MTEIIQTGGIVAFHGADEDLANRLEAFVQERDAFSPNTWRQLLSVMRISWRWTQENDRNFLPMASADLRDYLSYLQATGRASSTIATHAALISMLHRNAGLTPPNTSPLVFRTIKKINRTAVISGERTGQAVPFRLADLTRLDKHWAGSVCLREVRNLAFLHVAYSSLLRVSELSRLRVRDVTRAADGRIILDVAWTKTIVQTGGLIKALSALSTQRLTEWIAASGLAGEPDAFLFCPVHRSNRAIITAKPMSLPALEDIFFRAWQSVGPAEPARTNKGRYRGWSGHSARVGAAQDMAKQGYAVAQIMQEGTWKKPETLMRYIRNVDAHSGAMVDFMEKMTG
ncbi:MAG: tyrosine-type recombinase/integrase [Enterobacterales bacterium endosymbiont of Blomia tropicalis]|uniref:tyrosine-type recombinase/integrase n=1 Tax=Mixta mediterraneensis TaxID=2758443 RepID=UPI0025A71768|nr:tyrosine-type recombinase/integrase [Mixta mediterraneensis]MDL4916154.1 tyrosine-type recombinase/integrase [Mixta mediterraneensis]